MGNKRLTVYVRDNTRERINNEIGCNVFGRLQYIVTILERNQPDRDAEVRLELLRLLRFFPPQKWRKRK